jgi:hypothetical protein
MDKFRAWQAIDIDGRSVELIDDHHHPNDLFMIIITGESQTKKKWRPIKKSKENINYKTEKSINNLPIAGENKSAAKWVAWTNK